MQQQRYSGSASRSQNRKNAQDSKYGFPVEEKLSLLEALDHLHITKKYQEMGTCPVCKKISTKRCSACSTYYCSSECQNADWQKHKAVCIKRENEPDGGSFPKQKDGTSPDGHKNAKDTLVEEKLMLKSSGSPFTALANQLSRNTYNSSSRNSNSSQTLDRKLPSRNELRNMLSRSMTDLRKVQLNGSKVSCRKSRRMALSCKRDSSGTSVSDLEECKPSNGWGYTRANLVEVKKREVIGVHRESPDRFWVLDVKDAPTYEEIQTTLARDCGRYELIPPTVGLVCGCTFADEWYRGKILSTSPHTSVHFIDYGNVSNYEFDFVRKLPDDMKAIPGLAFLIEFEKGIPSEFRMRDWSNTQFTIQETRKTSDGVACVRIVEADLDAVPEVEQTNPSDEKPKPRRDLNARAIMDTITASTKGLLFLLPGEGHVRFGSLVPEDNERASACIEEVLALGESGLVPTVAQQGDYVLVAEKEQQVNVARGQVVSKTESIYYVRLLDCGNVILVKDLYAISENLVKLIELGVKITVETPNPKMKNLEACSFQMLGWPKSGKWPCLLSSESDNDPIAKVLLEKPPETLELEWRVTHLRSGSTVEISSFSSPNSFYVRAVDAEVEQKFMEMNTEMIQFASKAESFSFPPEPQVLCCAKFAEDQCFYRAVVTSVRGAGKVTVLFVDFGNEQETELKDVKPIPSSLKDIPCFAVRVSLRGVSGKPWNNSVKDYVRKLIQDNVELTLSYEGSVSEGVTLKEKRTGLVLNDFLVNAREQKAGDVFALQAVPPPCARRNDLYLDTDLEYTTVAPGSECNLVLLYVDEAEFEASHTFWATPLNAKNFDHVNGDLQDAITEHCLNNPQPYRPSVRELCLAEFEGFWYRAISVSNFGDVFNVFFVDFGNVCELRPESIRSIHKDFIKAPALAMNCAPNDRQMLKRRPELAKKVLTFLQEHIHSCFEGVLVTKLANNTFSVRIKEIEALLSG